MRIKVGTHCHCRTFLPTEDACPPSGWAQRSAHRAGRVAHRPADVADAPCIDPHEPNPDLGQARRAHKSPESMQMCYVIKLWLLLLWLWLGQLLFLRWSGQRLCVRLISNLRRPHRPSASGRPAGVTPLHQCVSFNDFQQERAQICAALLERSANPEMRTPQGATALHRAAGAGNLQCVQILVDKRVDVTAVDLRGRTALDLAWHNHAVIKCANDFGDLEAWRLLRFGSTCSSSLAAC